MSKVASQEQPFSSTKGLFAVQPLHLRRPRYSPHSNRPPWKWQAPAALAKTAVPRQCFSKQNNFWKIEDPSGKSVAPFYGMKKLWHLTLSCMFLPTEEPLLHFEVRLPEMANMANVWCLSSKVSYIALFYKLWHIFDIMCDLWLQFVSSMCGNSLQVAGMGHIVMSSYSERCRIKAIVVYVVHTLVEAPLQISNTCIHKHAELSINTRSVLHIRHLLEDTLSRTTHVLVAASCRLGQSTWAVPAILLMGWCEYKTHSPNIRQFNCPTCFHFHVKRPPLPEYRPFVAGEAALDLLSFSSLSSHGPTANPCWTAEASQARPADPSQFRQGNLQTEVGNLWTYGLSKHGCQENAKRKCHKPFN